MYLIHFLLIHLIHVFNTFLNKQWNGLSYNCHINWYDCNIPSNFCVRKPRNCLFPSLPTQKFSKVWNQPSLSSVEGPSWTLCLVSAVRNDKKFTLSAKHEITKYYCCSVTKSVSDSFRPHGLQHTRLLCPPLCLGVCSNSCPLSQ